MELRSHALLILSFIRSGERDRDLRRTPRGFRKREREREKLRGSLERSQGTGREKGREAEIWIPRGGERENGARIYIDAEFEIFWS